MVGRDAQSLSSDSRRARLSTVGSRLDMSVDDKDVPRGSLLRWLGLVMVGLLVAGVIVWSLSRARTDAPDPSQSTVADVPGMDSPSELVQQYVNAWSDGNFEAMQSLVGEQTEGFLHQHNAWADISDVASVGLKAGGINAIGDGQAMVPVAVDLTFITGHTWSYQTQLELSEQEDRWLLDWSPTVLHPSLGPTDTLRASVTWPERARILARDGTPLTDDRRAVLIGVVPERIEDVDALSEALLEHVGVGPERVRSALDAPGVQPDWFLPMTMLRPAAYREVRPDLYPVPGVVFRESTARLAPDEGFASHLLGRLDEITAEQLDELGDPYRVGDLVGKFGLESVFETQLAGSPAVEVTRFDESGDIAEILFEAPGRSPEPVQTTLDPVTQRAAERALSSVPEPSAIVALDTQTGEIRAAASRPLDEFNRALSGQYPPGSTFKIVTASALLNTGFEPRSPISCPDEIVIKGRRLSNAGGFSLGAATLLDAFAHSCNTTFAGLGADLSVEDLEESARRFGFNELYELPLPVSGGRFPTPEGSLEQAAASIGQGEVLASPLHMATVAAAVASGEWKPPRLLVGETDEGRPLSNESATLEEMMRAVVTEGTGRAANVDGEPTFGKTGSAEFGEGDPPPSHAWFVGYRDQLAFAVLVEGGGSGGQVAAPVAAEFLAVLDEELATDESPLAACASTSWPTFQGTNGRSGCSDAPSILEPRILWRQEVGIQGWLNNPVIADDRVYTGSAGAIRGAADPGDGVYSLSLRDGRVLWSHRAGNDVNGVAVAQDILVATGDEGLVWGVDTDSGSLRWVFPDEEESSGPLFTNPLILEGMAVVGGSDGILYAIDLETGELRWRAELDSAIRGGAASDGEAIYAVGEAGDARAFDLDGREYWREKLTFDGHGAETLTARVFAAPTLAGDLAVIPFVRDDSYSTPALLALDRYTGSVVWRGSDTDRIRDEWGNLRSSPAVVGDELVFGDPTFAGLIGVDLENGSAEWAIESRKHCLDQWPSPTRAGHIVILPQADGGLYAFDHQDREESWSIFLGEARQDGEFPVGFQAMSCSVLDPIFASAAVGSDGSVVVGTSEGYVFRIVDGP